METERRRATRTTPGELSYLQFEPEGGGIVLNASEEGLAFQAAAALRQSGLMRLFLSPHPGQRIELNAEIVWVDDAGKSGGLHLKEVPAEARDQIRQWLLPSLGSRGRQEEFVPPARAVDSLDGMSPFARSEIRDLAPTATPAPDNPTVRASAAAVAAPRIIRTPASPVFLEPLSLRDSLGVSRGRWLRGFATAFLVLILVLMPILLVQNFRLEVGNALIRMGDKLKSVDDVQSEPPSPPTSASPTSASPAPVIATPTSGTETNLPGADMKDFPKKADASSEPAPAAKAELEKVIAEKARLKERQASILPSQNAHSKSARSTSASQLWSEVEAGDSRAEVALAQLYLKGDGVPRNCEQARILLKAASKKGNAEALQQYRKLNATPCRSR